MAQLITDPQKLTGLYEKKRAGQPLGLIESLSVIAGGFQHFQERQFPSSARGVSFTRVAGQAVDLSDDGSKKEIRRILENTVTGGAFVVLGHGGCIPCGAVAAKKKAIELERRGMTFEEHPHIVRLVNQISPEISGLGSPQAEMINAAYQARKLLSDFELGEIIRKSNITVIAAVCSDTLEFTIMNRTGWNETKLFERHPKLNALRIQLLKGLDKVRNLGINLGTHYAHAILVDDPLLMRKVLDPNNPALDVGGISCVDARLSPNTPDSLRYLARMSPNTAFSVTVECNGETSFSWDDMGSIVYALNHVNGVNSLKEGSNGNGHIICTDTDLELLRATSVKRALLREEAINTATKNGAKITLLGFDGKEMRILNKTCGVDVVLQYNPEVNILKVPGRE